jgi:transitional endoplasmic reticulum ATPase
MSPEAELNFTRGLLHLRRGEAILPYAMSFREDKVPPGVDVALALVGKATVSASKALGQTGWIEDYKKEMNAALAHFLKASQLAPEHPEVHFRLAQVYRYLGQPEDARAACREAVNLSPSNTEFQSLLKVLEGGKAAEPNKPPAAPPIRTQNRNSSTSLQPKIEVEQPNLSWDDVILPPKTKRELRQMQLVLENPAQARKLGVDPPTGLLLYGPPGTGKTTIARVLAAQANCHFLTTNPSEVLSMWIGEGEKHVGKLFDEARKNAPSIIFLDEVDALIPMRVGGTQQHSDKLVAQFLHEMDGLSQNEGVFVVGATNRPDMLDPAAVRGGRLSRHIEIPLPDSDARQTILTLHLSGVVVDEAVDVALIAANTEGYSGADLKALVNDAGLQALIRIADLGGAQAVTTDDFAEAMVNLSKGDE